MAGIASSVGRVGKNYRPDVITVQRLINGSLPKGIVRLAEDGMIGPKTLAAIVAFQRQNVPALSAAPSGTITPGDLTWQRLNVAIRSDADDSEKHGMGVDIPMAKAWPAKFTFDQFIRFSEPLEGGSSVDHMFMVQDKQVATGFGLTFTGSGALAEAQRLPWFFKAGHERAGQRCSPTEVETDFNAVLGRPDLAAPGNLPAWRQLTSCRVSRQTLLDAARRKIVFNLNTVRLRRDAGAVGDFDNFPVDAQLCIASLTWAVGPNFGLVSHFKDFCAACRIHDFALAGQKCFFVSQVNTLPQRQMHQRTMMHNAELVEGGQGDFDTLYWPTRLHRDIVPIL